MPASGRCLCGQIQYQIIGELGDVRYCHCLRCREATGTAFSTNARILAENFKLISGREALRSYEMGLGIHRHFCGTCGSPVYVLLDREPAYIRPRIGGLTGEVKVKIDAHVWVGSKADWHIIADELLQYLEAKPRDTSAED